MCSETSPPRISFSHDLGPENHDVPIEQRRRDASIMGLNSDFEFSINSTIQQDFSAAEDLFCNGFILPLQIPQKVETFNRPNKFKPSSSSSLASLPPLPPALAVAENSKKEILNSDLEFQRQKSKSFWGFKRSSSLNSQSKKTSFCALPLLSRSYSTSSVPSPKRTTLKDFQKHNSQKQSSISMGKSSSSNSYSTHQKPPLKKKYKGFHGSYVWINPVLNVPPPYSSKRIVNFFGLGSLLSSGKDKKSKT